VSLTFASAWGQEPPLTAEDIGLLLQSGLSEETIAAYVQTRGLTQALTTAEEEQLRAVGATDTLLETIRTFATTAPSSPDTPPDTPLKPTEASEAAQAPRYQFRTTTRVVRVPVSVTDKKGRPMTDLPQQAFRVLQDGEARAIDLFSTERKPLRIGVLLDVSASMGDKIDEVADALKHFIELLEPEDEIFVLAFNDQLDLLQDFTSDRKRLGIVLEGLRPIGGTALNDAVIEGLSLLNTTPAESKALVLVTDGVDTASGSSFEAALEAARRTETPVYSIGLGHGRSRRFEFLGAHGSSAGTDFDDRPLRELAEETGGGAQVLVDLEHHHGTGVDRIQQAAESIAVTLRNRYLIGYQPPEEPRKPGWRKIRVEVDRPSVTVRARKGYYDQGLL